MNLTGATNDFTTFAASATVAIGLLEANDVQVDQIAAVGSLAALKGITASLGAGLRTLAGSVTQTVDGVITGGTGGLSVSVTGGNIGLDTAENATKLVAFSSPGTASYKTSTDINVGQVGALGNNPATMARQRRPRCRCLRRAPPPPSRRPSWSARVLTLATGEGARSR